MLTLAEQVNVIDLMAKGMPACAIVLSLGVGKTKSKAFLPRRHDRLSDLRRQEQTANYNISLQNRAGTITLASGNLNRLQLGCLDTWVVPS